MLSANPWLLIVLSLVSGLVGGLLRCSSEVFRFPTPGSGALRWACGVAVN